MQKKLYFRRAFFMTMMKKTSIKEWEESDRPREKLLEQGASALSIAELMAILMGSGNARENAVELARRILHDANDNLVELSRKSISEFTVYNGVGPAKAVSIVAGLELGKRRMRAEALKKKKISSSRDAFELLRAHLMDLRHEEFWIILLDRANNVLSSKIIGEGGLTGTIADPKKIFRIALENGACGIILCHNHPSDNLKPSQPDIAITKKLKDSGSILDITILDHLIFGASSYYSFADEGIL